MKNKSYYILNVPAGSYHADNIFILLLEIAKHRLFHLFNHGRWID